MIIFIEHGRLGNQIFQYVALRSYASDGKLILVGFDELKEVFCNIDARFVLSNKSFIFKLLKRFRNRVNKIFKHIPFFATIDVSCSNEGIYLYEKKGLVNKLKYAFTNFYQSEGLMGQKTINNICIDQKIKNNAIKILNSFSANQQLVFIHIRRGDYLSWPSSDFPAVLPLSWYTKCMDKTYEYYENPFFVVASDDFYYAYDVFSDRNDVYITAADKETDFALMALCQGGILSASSFAWWAACFAKDKNPNGRFLAPLYWAGHRKGEWHPPHIKSSFLEYVEVDSM